MLSSVSNLSFKPKPLPFWLHSSASVHSKFSCKLGHVVSFRFVTINTAWVEAEFLGLRSEIWVHACMLSMWCLEQIDWQFRLHKTKWGFSDVYENFENNTLCIVHISYLCSETTSAHLPLMIGALSFRAKWWRMWVDIPDKHCVLAPHPQIAIS